jgi:hypothetical protein
MIYGMSNDWEISYPVNPVEIPFLIRAHPPHPRKSASLSLNAVLASLVCRHR